MPRVATSNQGLGMWLDGENPGAGTQVQSAIGNGLNDNWKRIDNCLANVNSDGSFKNASIDAANLKSTVADGSTLIQDSGSKKLRVTTVTGDSQGLATDNIKDSAITNAKLAAGAVTTAKVATNDLVGYTVLFPLSVTNSELGSGAAKDFNVATNSAVRKHYVYGVIKSGDTKMRICDIDPATGQGVPMPFNGMITAYFVNDASGNNDSVRVAYSATGTAATGRFGLGDRVTAYRNISTGVTYPAINGTNVTGLAPTVGGGATDDLFVTIEYELDNLTT